MVNHWKPRAQTSVVSRYPSLTPCSRLRLALLATMHPAPILVGHWVPRTKPTCLFTPWWSPRHRPSTLVLHLHQHKSSRKLRRQYTGPRVSPHHVVNHSSLRSDHPPVLGHIQVLKTLPLWAPSKDWAPSRPGDSRSHHWCLVVEGNRVNPHHVVNHSSLRSDHPVDLGHTQVLKTLPYEHLRRTEHPTDLEIPEVTIDASL
jgi:hypothetical protein